MRLLTAILLALPALCADTLAPSIESISPSGAGAPTNTKILIRTSCCISITPFPVTLTTGASSVSGTAEFVDSRWILFTPAQPLLPNTTYTVAVSMPYRAPSSATFTTGSTADTTPPRLLSTSPAQLEDNIALAQPVRYLFSEPINPKPLATLPFTYSDLASSSSFPYARLTLGNADTVEIGSSYQREAGRVYRVQFTGALPEDLCGNRAAAPIADLLFTTYPYAPKDGPRLAHSIPEDSATEVPTNSAILLLFDRPIMTPPAASFSLSADGDPNVATKLETLTGNNGVILRPQTLLRANRRYTLSIHQLYDLYGGKLAAGPLLRFTSAALPEFAAFSAASVPASFVPNIGVLRWRFSRAVNPFFLPGLRNQSFSTETPVHLLDDGVTLEATVPGPGPYTLTGPVYDRLESRPLSLSYSEVTVSPLPDDQPPSVLASFPSGAAAPPTVLPSIAFNEQLLPPASDQILLYQGDTPVAITTSVSDALFTLRPKAPLQAGLDYKAVFRAPCDLAGNTAPDVTWSFTVEASAPAEPFHLVQADPVSDAVAASTATTLAFTFSHPVNPVSLARNCRGVVTAGGAIAGRWRTEASRAFFQPDHPLPPATRISWEVCAEDFYGRAIPAAERSGAFWTEASDEPPPPLFITSVTPEGAQPAVSGSNAIFIRFNRPVAATSLYSTITLTGAGQQRVQISISYDPATLIARLSTDSVYLDGQFTLLASPEVRGLSGERLEPFTTTIRFVPRSSPLAPRPTSTIIRSAAFTTASGYAISNPPVVIVFNAPADRALVQQGLTITVAGAPISGRFDWAPDNSALTFFPSSPVPPDTRGLVLLSLAPWRRAGAESIEIGSGMAPFVYAPVWNVTSPVPPDAVIELSFDRDLPEGFITSATARSSTPGGIPDSAHNISFQVDRRTPRIFRLSSKDPFSRSHYNIEALSQDGAKYLNSFTTATYTTPSSRQIDFGPTELMGDAPLNAVVWLQFHTLLNPATLNARLSSGGDSVRIITETRDRAMTVLLRPVGLLRAGALYTVELPGLEDLAGRPLPVQPFSFTTSSGVDIVPATVLSLSPTGDTSTAAIPQAVFSKPAFHLRSSGGELAIPHAFSFDIDGIRIQGDIQSSPDRRTHRFFPNRAWPIGASISLPILGYSFFDWTGTSIYAATSSSGDINFTPVSAPSTAPAVTARNPLPDSTGVPRNVLIQARFDAGILPSSLDGVTLSSGGTVVPARASLSADRRTVTLIPLECLDAGRLYTISLSGLLATDLTPAAASDWSFTTSNLAPLSPAAPTVTALRGDPFRFRIHFASAVNPLSLAPSVVRATLNGASIACDLQLSDDARSLLVTMLSPAPPNGIYFLSTAGLTDSTGASFPQTLLTLSSAQPTYTTPPAVSSLLPAPGATASWNAKAYAVFDRPVALRDGSAGVRLTLNGSPVDATVSSTSSTTFSIVPVTGWRLGGAYQIELSNVIDQDANLAGPVSWNFTIAASPSPALPNLRLVSTSPAPGAAGVDPSTPLLFEYSNPVVLAGESSHAITLSPYSPARPRVTVDGKTVRIDPVPAWKSGTSFSLLLSVVDLYSTLSNQTLFFSTAASLDTTPPQVDSILPAPASTLPAGRNEFLISFSEPIAPGPNNNNVTVSCNGSAIAGSQPFIPAQGDGRSLAISLQLPASSTCTLSLTSALTDLSGNPLPPVSFEYSTLAEGGDLALSVSTRPLTGYDRIPVDASISLVFNLPVSEAALIAALRVTNDGYVVPVTLAAEPGNRVWTLQPPGPWLAGSIVNIELESSLYSESGIKLEYRYRAQFRTRAADGASASLSAVLANSSFIDLRFSAPLATPPEEPFGLRLLHQRIPVAIDRMGPAWYRLTPGAPLDPAAAYTLMAGPGLEIPLRLAPIDAFAEPSQPSLETGPSGRITLHFDRPIHPFSLDAATLLLDAAGNPVAATASVSDDLRTVAIEPLSSRRPAHLRWNGLRRGIPD